LRNIRENSKNNNPDRRDKMKLYEIGKELAAINDQLIDAQGEISPDLEKRLDELQLALVDKATGIRKWYAIIETDGAAVATEISRLQRIQKQNENLQTRLKNYIKHNMELADIKKLETAIGTFTVCKNPDSVEIIPEQVPEEYLDIVPEHYELNKERLTKDVKSGKIVPGTKLINDKTHVRVK
jgi:DNA repair exonuclease SbcCD ATPase subunit